MSEVWQTQQARKRSEVWYGEWSAIRSAILSARGARETSDVNAEERGFDLVFNGTPLVCEAGPAFAVAPGGVFDWIQRLLYGEPIDYTEDRLP